MLLKLLEKQRFSRRFSNWRRKIHNLHVKSMNESVLVKKTTQVKLNKMLLLAAEMSIKIQRKFQNQQNISFDTRSCFSMGRSNVSTYEYSAPRGILYSYSRESSNFIAIAGNHPTLNEQKYFKKRSLCSNGVT